MQTWRPVAPGVTEWLPNYPPVHLHMIRIRPYASGDIQSVLRLMNRVIAEGESLVYEEPFDQRGMREWIATWSAAFVAEVDQTSNIAGAYFSRPNQPGRGSHIANAAYVVDPDLRGRGVGRNLGRHSLEETKRAGFSAMQFNAVVATNEPAVRLWRALGFEEIGRVPKAFRRQCGQWVDLLVMHRQL